MTFAEVMREIDDSTSADQIKTSVEQLDLRWRAGEIVVEGDDWVSLSLHVQKNIKRIKAQTTKTKEVRCV